MPILYKPLCGHDGNFAFPTSFHVVLKANGFWPTDGDVNSSLFRFLDKLYTFWNWIVIGTVTLTVCSEVMYLFVNFSDVAQAAENMCMTMIGAMICIRMLHMSYARGSLKQILGIFSDKIWITKESHPLVFERCIRNMKPIFYLSLAMLPGTALYIALPIIVLLSTRQTLDSTDKRMPYFISLPYDQQKPLNYVITYIVCGYAGAASMLQFYAMDAMFSLFISFACGQFEILHGQILRLIPECHAEWLRRYVDGGAAEAGNLRYLEDIYTKRLHELIAFHSDIICFCSELEKFFSFPLMANVAISTLLIGFGGFQILVGGRNSFVDFTRFLLFLVSVTGQLYVICELGTLLIIRSTVTARHLFTCNWEGGRLSHYSPLLLHGDEMELDEMSVELPAWRHISYHPTGKDFRKKLSFMILRSHRPVQLTAMKFTILSLETFGRILSSSISYFALLKSFMDKHNNKT